MKTQILQLEAHDDLISARDKISACKARRVLLVWQQKTHMIHRKLDLVLLQRHSNALGIQIGLVTQDEAVRFYASELGIPTFTTTRQAQVERWRGPRRRRKPARPERPRTDLLDLYQAAHPGAPAWLEHPGFRLTMFSLSLAAVLAILALLLPGAQISLAPGVQLQQITLPVQTNPNIKQPLLTGELPVNWASVVVEGRDSQPASGVSLAPETAAVGEVVFTNLTEQTIEVPAGVVVTTLETPPLRFVTTQAVKVPKGIGKTSVAPVQAVVPGKSGNLPANRLQAIEGTLGLSLTVNNPMPTRQGKDQFVASPTEQDRKKLFERLQAALQNTAKQEVERLLSEDNLSSPSSTVTGFPILQTLRVKQVLEETYLPEAGQPGDELTLILRLEFEYQVITATDLQALAIPILNASLPAGFQPVTGSLRITHHSPIEVDSGGNLRWKITIQQTIQNQIHPEQVTTLVRGAPVERAGTLLQDLNLAHPPYIRVSPGWWPVMPYLPFRIEVHIQTENG